MDWESKLGLFLLLSVFFYLLREILEKILKAIYRNNELLSETKKELELLNRRMDK